VVPKRRGAGLRRTGSVKRMSLDRSFEEVGQGVEAERARTEKERKTIRRAKGRPRAQMASTGPRATSPARTYLCRLG
jgi:hypothetical protein